MIDLVRGRLRWCEIGFLQSGVVTTTQHELEELVAEFERLGKVDALASELR